MAVLKAVVIVLAGLVVLGTAIPFVRTDEWWVRVFDFPRLQLAALGLALVVSVILWPRLGGVIRWWLAGFLLLAVVVQCWHLFPYTPLARREVLAAGQRGPALRILIINVLQENRQSERLLQVAEETSADLILTTEVDEWWTRELGALERTHPHAILRPQGNGYGMNLYSRFPLHRPEVRFLTDPGVPSFRTGVEVSGQVIRLYAVHPRPPGRLEPGGEGVQDSGQRDAELVLIAREVGVLSEPVIVAGDFNDVAWSHTTRLFKRVGRLLDPRVGRGLYNSYHVRTPFLRFPLDHLFHSEHFKCADLCRLKSVGSDHFPIFVNLRLDALAPSQQEPAPEKPSDAREAEKTLEEERR